jgi:hypothetical protein
MRCLISWLFFDKLFWVGFLFWGLGCLQVATLFDCSRLFVTDCDCLRLFLPLFDFVSKSLRREGLVEVKLGEFHRQRKELSSLVELESSAGYGIFSFSCMYLY